MVSVCLSVCLSDASAIEPSIIPSFSHLWAKVHHAQFLMAEILRKEQLSVRPGSHYDMRPSRRQISQNEAFSLVNVSDDMCRIGR